MPGERQTPTVRLRRLAAELRLLRTSSGFTRDEIVERTGINVATLYRIEHARVRPQTRTLRTLLALYGVEGPHQDELIALLRDARQRGWLHAYQSVLPEQYTTYIGFEGEARGVWNYESLYVPGLVQTEDYARAVILIANSQAPKDEIDRRVSVRMKRKQLLTQPGAPELWTVLDEAALRRPPNGPEVMRAQLEHLLEMTDLPNVTLQIVPFRVGPHAAAGGPFTILRFSEPDVPDVVYLEQLNSAVYLDQPEDVLDYMTVMNQLVVQAETGTASRAILRDLLRQA
jgi:transcriptional regulator with XRE-family HTH domain